MENGVVNIHLLGDLSISQDDVEVTYSDLSSQICTLVAFLVVNRNKIVNIDTISEVLWPDGVSNPGAALKNLVYRMRKIFEDKKLAAARDLIISSQGSYRLNPSLSYIVDIELLTQFASEAKVQTKDEDRKKYYTLAISCYSGEFLSCISHSEWSFTMERQYHSIYFKSVYSLLEIYHREENYEDMVVCAKQATYVDKFEENAYRYLMLALAKLGRSVEAISLYRHVRDMFFKELGVELSADTRNIFNEISKSAKVKNTDIISLSDELKETNVNDALYCEFEVFKQIYRFGARSAVRTGDSIFIGLMTVESTGKQPLDKELQENAMHQLSLSIRNSLRKGDVYSRCSPSQYVIMLSMINFENGLKVLNRVKKAFKSEFHSRKVVVIENVKPVELSFWE